MGGSITLRSRVSTSPRQSRIREEPVVSANAITWVGMDAHQNSIRVTAFFPGSPRAG
jgi:hypothetical protein